MSPEISRRNLIGAALVGVNAVASQGQAAPLPYLAPDYRRGLLMKGLLRESLHVSSLKGTFYAVEGGTTTPLHGAVMCSFIKNKVLPDGSVQTKTIEVEWYTTVDGEIMDEWNNPLTGKTVPVKQMDSYFVNTIIITPDGRRKSLTYGAGVYEKILSWREDGDDIWMFNQLSSQSFDPTAPLVSTAAPKFIATELATYHARRSEFNVPGITKVRTESYHSCTGEFRPWQQMGGHPGYQLLLCNNRSMDSRDELPPEWLKHTARYFPELLKSPEALLDA